MKKYLKISACAMMAIAMALTITSCKKNNGGGDTPTPTPTPTPEVTCNYRYYMYFLNHTFTIDKFSPTSADIRAIDAYFNEKGIKPIYSTIDYTITGATQEECDLKAKVKIKDEWDATIAKINAADIQPMLQEKTYFDYYWYRELDGGKEDTIGVWSCPVNTNFKTYGKFSMGEDEYEVTRTNMPKSNDNLLFELYMSGGVNFYKVVFLNATEFPTEQVNVAYGTEIQAVISINNETYFVVDGTLKMTKKSDYVYDIEASGKAIHAESRPINFTLNCADVPF